ncbi:hypothetical protein H6G80_03135 [Nostoc sp. FACHB-87]|uniref:hypothetical protein n=1 Tax=Nostocaceae TaxID=1162 RepID=UPI0016843CCF|nr:MULTISPECIES: hypothetical protein [Nostocaceae]MBD2416068.1 hypothetical protein [Nostoc calcicola FACHB-3891]MBD2453068.1 hypothetical protein [Nostoc sp. FACHB-87]MBD2475154.1 hypothetical protein [Anabaena sp. FACHB-83]
MPLSNPNVITPSACYRRTANLVLTSNSLTKLSYNSKEEDTHNAYNSTTGNTTSGRFTVVSGFPGKYRLNAGVSINFNANGNPAGTTIIALYVYKNNSLYCLLGRSVCTGISGASDGANGYVDIPNLIVGDFLDVRVNAIFTTSNGIISLNGSDNCPLSISYVQ